MPKWKKRSYNYMEALGFIFETTLKENRLREFHLELISELLLPNYPQVFSEIAERQIFIRRPRRPKTIYDKSASLSVVPSSPPNPTMSESVPGCSKSDSQAAENPFEMVDVKEEVMSNSSLNWDDTPEPTQTLEVEQNAPNNTFAQNNNLAAILLKIHEEMKQQTNLLLELNTNIQSLNQFVMANNNPGVLHGRPSVIRRENA